MDLHEILFLKFFFYQNLFLLTKLWSHSVLELIRIQEFSNTGITFACSDLKSLKITGKIAPIIPTWWWNYDLCRYIRIKSRIWPLRKFSFFCININSNPRYIFWGSVNWNITLTLGWKHLCRGLDKLVGLFKLGIGLKLQIKLLFFKLYCLLSLITPFPKKSCLFFLKRCLVHKVCCLFVLSMKTACAAVLVLMYGRPIGPYGKNIFQLKVHLNNSDCNKNVNSDFFFLWMFCRILRVFSPLTEF